MGLRLKKIFYFKFIQQSLGKNIENLKNTSKNIIGTYPDLDSQVTGAANDVKHMWDEMKEKAKKARKLIDLSIEYFNLIDQVSPAPLETFAEFFLKNSFSNSS